MAMDKMRQVPLRIARKGGVHLMRFETASRNKEGEAFPCFKCMKPFRTKRWTMQDTKGPHLGYVCLTARCPECKTRSFKRIPKRE